MTRHARRLVIGLVLGLLAGVTLWWFLLAPRGTGSEGAEHARDVPERPLRVRLVGSGERISPNTDGAALRVVVVDEANGRPLPGAALHSSGHDDLYVSPAEYLGATGPDGVLPSERLIVTRRDGYVPAVVELLAAKGEPQRIALTRGQVLRGRVVDVDGNPVRGAEVHAMGRHGSALRALLRIGAAPLPGPRAAGDLQRTLSDEDGRFALEGILGFPVDVRAAKPGYVQPGLQRVADASTEFALTLHPMVRAGIAMEDEHSGAIIHSYQVVLEATPDLSPWLQDPHTRLAEEPRTGWEPTTGQTWFTWMVMNGSGSGVRVGFRVEAAGYEAYEGRLEPQRPGEVSVQRVKLRPANGPTGQLEVRLRLVGVDVDVSHCGVRMTSEEGVSLGVRIPLDADGRGVVLVRPGTYRVLVDWPTNVLLGWPPNAIPPRTLTVTAGQTASLEVQAPAAIVDVVAERAGASIPLFDFAIWRDGRRLEDVQMQWLLGGGEEYGDRVPLDDRPGSVRLVVSPGHHRFRLLQPFRSPFVDLTVAFGDHHTVRLIGQP
jgi:hypothetical protein